jgi:hypothetical protein
MTAEAKVPVRVILDTDMGSDCDDAGAMAVLHALADQGEVEILACIYSSEKNQFGPGCIAAINQYYGRGEIPIGAAKGDEVGDPRNDFLEAIASNAQRYGHRVRTCDDVPDQVAVYRRALASAPDRSVTVISIGHTKGLLALLHSGPCDFSPANGHGLVALKVKEWVVMGGAFPVEERPGWNFGANGSARYSRALVAEWPGAVVFSGYEVGSDIITGPCLQGTPDDNPVKTAYRLWDNALENGRASWDQTAVLYAVRGTGEDWELCRGRCEVEDDGRTTWQVDECGPHAYLVKRRPAENLTLTIGDLMARPPERRGVSSR